MMSMYAPERRAVPDPEERCAKMRRDASGALGPCNRSGGGNDMLTSMGVSSGWENW